MPKSKKKRANPFVEQWGFRVDRVIRSVVPEPVEVIHVPAQRNSVVPIQIYDISSETELTNN